VFALSEGTIAGLGESAITDGAYAVNVGGSRLGGTSLLSGAWTRKKTNQTATTLTWDAGSGAIALHDWANAMVRKASGSDAQWRKIVSVTAPNPALPQYINSVTIDGANPWVTSDGVEYFIIQGGFRLYKSETPGTAIPWLGTWNPGTLAFEGDAVGMGFGGTAYLASETFPLDTSGKPPSLDFQVRGKFIVGGSTDPDVGNPYSNANPADVVVDILTNPRYSVRLATSQVDVAAYRTYCANRGFLVSRAITGQETAATLLSQLMVCTNSVFVKSGGVIRVVPRDEFDNATAVVLDDNEILAEGGQDPVAVERVREADVYNVYPVEIENRYAGYATAVYETEDAAHIAKYGMRRAESVRLDWIKEPKIAQRISSLIAQRSIYVRNYYTFTVKPRWSLLEPMDFVAITHRAMGMYDVLARIVSTRRLSNGAIEIRAEEAPPGSATPVDLTPPSHDGFDSVRAAPPITSPTTVVSPSPPLYPDPGTTWVDTTTDGGEQTKVWNGTGWILCDAFQTTNYAPGGTVGTDTEYATSGAKMRRNDGMAANAPALLVDPKGLKIGQHVVDEAWFARSQVVSSITVGRDGTSFAAASGADSGPNFLAYGSWDSTNKRLRLLYNAQGVLSDMHVIGTIRTDSWSSPGYSYYLRQVAWGASGSNRYIDLELWRASSTVDELVDWAGMPEASSPQFSMTCIAYSQVAGWL
jgi:hypothetical protein